jgi:hypothetical protein
MTARKTGAIGGAVGLTVSGAVLFLLYRFGVWRLMKVGSTDLRVLLWPSSIMLVGRWYSTVPGIMTTLSSVAINCLIYAAVALLLRGCIRGLRRIGR